MIYYPAMPHLKLQAGVILHTEAAYAVGWTGSLIPRPDLVLSARLVERL